MVIVMAAAHNNDLLGYCRRAEGRIGRRGTIGGGEGRVLEWGGVKSHDGVRAAVDAGQELVLQAGGARLLAGRLWRHLRNREDDEVAGVGANVEEREGEIEGCNLNHGIGYTTDVRAVYNQRGCGVQCNAYKYELINVADLADTHIPVIAIFIPPNHKQLYQLGVHN